ncbi:unnamed protein product [Tuber melanosporum]|uniref:(Perigord truffle) hypothetical protein n=1 Tax=Tuber melanosporum (strain Mel28) TaxID=656061 RepID=D5G4F6_TUBMM|nr:uncharacterized protein GSTUM_00004087001 [Tuber melanosporum]CAZ79399.1 unnamed protein product [Tuber melanosporum]
MAATKDSLSRYHPPSTPNRPPALHIKDVPVKTPPPSSSSSHHRSSLGSSGSSHRITRRKSMSSTSGANIAAVVQAAVRDGGEAPFALSVPASGIGMGLGRSPGSTKILNGSACGGGMEGYPSPPSSLPTTGPLGGGVGGIGGAVSGIAFTRKVGSLVSGGDSAIAEGHASDVGRPARSRRASEGAHVHLGESGDGVGGRVRARSGSELKCDKCGKGYKHSSCLTKHLWEHTPEWSYTSKLLISKHQQVQLLEAASILVSMNPTTTPPASSSGASNNEGNSSTNDSSSSSDDTTPPPSVFSGSDVTSPLPTPRGIRNGAGKPGKRYSSGSHSRSYQAPSGSGALAGSAPNSTAFPNHFPHHRPSRPRAGSSAGNIRGSHMTSPATRPTSITPEDEALAAAIELLSCSFNTPVMGPTVPLGSVPRGIAGLSSPPVSGRPGFLGPPLNDVVEMKREEGEEGDDVRMEDLEERRNVMMEEDDDEDEEEDDDDDEEEEEEEEEEVWKRRGRSEEDEDGVFGQMEE